MTFLGLPRFDNPALCAETDPDAFFPEKGGSLAQAKAVCARCAAQAECLEWALEHDEMYGVWAGTTDRQRRVLRRRAPGRPRKDGAA